MSYANRGMAFETQIEFTLQHYKRKGLALINKRPTPVKILGTNSRGMINGYPEKPSTVDYDGVYKGRAICFEAKSTEELNRFPLRNVTENQYEYLESSHNHGAISFLLIEFAKHRTVYLLPFPTLKHHWQGVTKGGVGRSSITLECLDVHAYQIDSRGIVDFLCAVDKAWGLAA